MSVINPLMVSIMLSTIVTSPKVGTPTGRCAQRTLGQHCQTVGNILKLIPPTYVGNNIRAEKILGYGKSGYRYASLKLMDNPQPIAK